MGLWQWRVIVKKKRSWQSSPLHFSWSLGYSWKDWVGGREAKLWNYSTFGICRGKRVKAKCSAPDSVIIVSCTVKSLHILLVTWSVEYMKCISQWANCAVFTFYSQYITQPLLFYKKQYISILKFIIQHHYTRPSERLSFLRLTFWQSSLKVMKNVLLATLIGCTKLSNVLKTLVQKCLFLIYRLFMKCFF